MFSSPALYSKKEELFDPIIDEYEETSSLLIEMCIRDRRDTYFDCPDRERAQWWGDVVLLMGESFYTYSPSAHALMKKAIYELVGWQKKNGVLYAPIPSGSSDTELPGQSLASIGRYGFWKDVYKRQTYYWHI